MKISKLKSGITTFGLAALVGSALINAPLARAQAVDPNPVDATAGGMIGIGAGGIIGAGADTAAAQNEIEVLIRIDGAAYDTNKDQAGGYLVIGHLRGDATTSGSYIDVTFEPLAFGHRFIDGSVVRDLQASFAKADLERNLALDENQYARLTVVGFAGDIKGNATSFLKLGLNASLDLLSLTVAERASDGVRSTGASIGGKIEGSAEIGTHFRIALGTQGNELATGGFTETFYDRGDAAAHGYDPDNVCTTSSSPTGEYFYDEDGYEHEIYQDDDDCSVHHYDQIHTITKNYLSITASLNSHIQLFGVAQYAVYKVGSDTGAVDESKHGRKQLLFGASNKF
jgi:hypothetical protein